MIAKLFSSPATSWGGIIAGVAAAWPSIMETMGRMNGEPGGSVDWRWILVGAALIWLGITSRDNNKRSEDVKAGEAK